MYEIEILERTEEWTFDQLHPSLDTTGSGEEQPRSGPSHCCDHFSFSYLGSGREAWAVSMDRAFPSATVPTAVHCSLLFSGPESPAILLSCFALHPVGDVCSQQRSARAG